jgi:haloalkane dehalogenase
MQRYVRLLRFTHRLGINCGNAALELDRVERRQVTRREFGVLLLGGLAGLGCTTATPSASVITAAEAEGPDHLPRRGVKVLDTEISYVDTGTGEPVVFLHGSPTWSSQWRNIIPSISRPHRRCLAPDLVGMGWSGKSPTQAYRFVGHARYMDAWFGALWLTKNVSLVGHDWGAAIGFYRARRHPEQIKAIAYMEAVVQPRRWDDFSGGRDKLFRALRSPEGERLVLDENVFVEVALPRGILRKLGDEEMEA